MEGMTGGGLGFVWLIFMLFLIVLVILWILMPFAIFGTKDRLNTLIEETRQQNELLTEVRDILKKVG